PAIAVRETRGSRANTSPGVHTRGPLWVERGARGRAAYLVADSPHDSDWDSPGRATRRSRRHHGRHRRLEPEVGVSSGVSVSTSVRALGAYTCPLTDFVCGRGVPATGVIPRACLTFCLARENS